ncbi:MAG TPA: hypothetical protein VHB30_06540 [Solirubrobacteraceae bacterium]|nr:hypothetical protein [Solirubrobacteraceae bacterium]
MRPAVVVALLGGALGSWKAIEQRWYTTAQASIASYDAYRTSIDAEKVIEQTDATLQGG